MSRETDRTGELLLRVAFQRRPLWPEQPASLVLGAASGLALVVAALALFAPDRHLAELLAAGTLLSLPFAALWALPRRWPPPAIECRSDALWAPRFMTSRRQLRIPYESLFDAVVSGSGQGLMLGVRGRLPLRYASSGLGDDAPRVVACVRAQIAALPDGAERLHAFDERARVSTAGDAVPWASWSFVAVLFLAFVAQSAVGVTGWEPVLLSRLGANSPLLVERGEFYRIFSANLLHANIGHLYVNGMLLMLLGPRLEATLGGARTAFVLLVSAAGGAALSSLASPGLLSIGASTAVFGVVAAFLYVNVARRRELPADLRAPAWLVLALAVVQVGSELRVANVDHLAHLGGLASGWLAAAIAIGRDRLAELREEPRSTVHVGLVSIAVLWIGALGWAGVRSVSPDLESQALLTEEVFRRDAAPAQILSRHAVRWALDRETPERRLRVAADSIERATRRNPTDPDLWDTAAILRAANGSREGAIIAQWNAAVLDATPARLLRLALYERDQVEEKGPMRMGLGSRMRARFGFDLDGAADAATLDLELSHPPLRGAVLHALVYQGESLVGHMELWLGPSTDRGLRFESEDLRATGATQLEFRVALIDTRPKRLPARSVQVRFWTLTSAQVQAH